MIALILWAEVLYGNLEVNVASRCHNFLASLQFGDREIGHVIRTNVEQDDFGKFVDLRHLASRPRTTRSLPRVGAKVGKEIDLALLQTRMMRFCRLQRP